MMPEEEVVCCGVIEKIAAEFDMPFERPFLVRMGQLKVGSWSLRLANLTPAGNLSKKGGSFLFLTYCPACGKKLVDDDGP